MSEVVKVEDTSIKLVSNVVPEKELRSAQLRALKLFATTVGRTYGPMGGYTAYSMSDPNKPTKAITSYYTKDGLTALKHISIDKPIEDILRDDIRTICTQVVKSIGDGTTSAVLLSYYIFKGLLDLQKEFPKRAIINTFKKLIDEGIEAIKNSDTAHECTVDDIYKIALTSLNGNEKIASLIKEIYESCGMNVFIDVSSSNSPETKVKVYNGLTYDQGFIDPCFINNVEDQSCTMEDVDVYVFESPIDTPDMQQDLAWIIEENYNKPLRIYKMQQEQGRQVTQEGIVKPTIIICPMISRDMNSYIDQLVKEFTTYPPEAKGYLCIVTNIDNDNQYLMDIAQLTGATFIKKYIDPKNYAEDRKKGLAPTQKNIKNFAGKAERVIVDAISTRIINPKNMYDGQNNYTEFYKNYMLNLETTLAKYEETREDVVKIGRLKRRINILKTNMVDLYVGGIGTSDRMALTDSIEDAVLNCRSAAQEGVCYGANYEGLNAFNKIALKYENDFIALQEKEKEILLSLNDDEKLIWLSDLSKDKEFKEEFKQARIVASVASLLLSSYLNLCVQLYKPYTDDDEAKAASIVIAGISNEDHTKRCPFNIITESYDGNVCTSIMTEPSILDSISRIISLLFDTNQFLVPDARFNIYTMNGEDQDDSDLATIASKAIDKKKEEKPEGIKLK